jgi:hypothetical protein
MSSFDFISTTDKPALLVIDNQEVLANAKAALLELNYKVHNIDSHEEFSTRFAEVHYQVVVIDEAFGGPPETNQTLHTIQWMPMNMRRHAVVLLLGGSFETLNAMQAFQQSVHAVINYSEITLLPQLIQKVASDNDMFLEAYRDTVKRVAQTRYLSK